MIFSVRCFSKDKPESSMRPKCFCSFTFATAVPLNGLDGLDSISYKKIRLQWPA